MINLIYMLTFTTKLRLDGPLLVATNDVVYGDVGMSV